MTLVINPLPYFSIRLYSSKINDKGCQHRLAVLSNRGWDKKSLIFDISYYKCKRLITKYIEKGSKVLSTLEPFSIYMLF